MSKPKAGVSQSLPQAVSYYVSYHWTTTLCVNVFISLCESAAQRESNNNPIYAANFKISNTAPTPTKKKTPIRSFFQNKNNSQSWGKNAIFLVGLVRLCEWERHTKKSSLTLKYIAVLCEFQKFVVSMCKLALSLFHVRMCVCETRGQNDAIFLIAHCECVGEGEILSSN